jgi:hypothetical protein
MFANILLPPATCAPVLYSRVVGLPVTACSEADRKARMQRQALRQELRQRQAAASRAGQVAQSLERPSLDTSLQAIMSGQGLPAGGGAQDAAGRSGQQAAAARSGGGSGGRRLALELTRRARGLRGWLDDCLPEWVQPIVGSLFR